MTKADKVYHIAMFFANKFEEGHYSYQYLIFCHDEWERVYNENKSKMSFDAAKLVANIFIVNKILSL